ncbi:hypothetical protein ACLKA7_009373 [Drosophila subpalustris]
MAETKTDLSDWNPMADEYNDERFNKYDSVNEAPSDNKGEDRNSKQVKYPYLVVKKEKNLITETVLRNFFGNSIIYDIEYRLKSCVYFVYFHNMCSIEAAWSRIRQFPNIVHCVQGRPNQNQNQTLLPSLPNDAAADNKMPEPTFNDANPVDMHSRNIHVSAKRNNHPEFHKASIVVKADYTVKNSLLAKNDANFRYMNVKFEFALERQGAYVLHETMEKDQAIVHFRSGRIFVTPQRQLETKESDGNSKIAQLANKCLACKCYTDNSCRFCKMPFCNPVCFDAISAVHKETCDKGNPPVLDDHAIVPQFTKPMLPPSGATVKITAFEQSNVLYVRSAEIVTEVAYFKVLSDVMMQGSSSPKLIKLPQCGQIVIYKFDAQIVRAMVLNTENPKAIYVVCVDYGSVEITTLENLYECNDYLAALPRYAVPVLLRSVPNRYMCPNLLEMMYELDYNYTFVLKYSEREFDFQRGMQRVILIESDLNRSLNRLIKTILTPIQPSISEDGFTEDYLQHVHLPAGKSLDLVVMDNTFLKFGVVHCTILDFAYEITRMQRDIHHYAESISTCSFYAPPKNILCIAKYQDKWCRGLCMELVGDGHPSILFIDYGNIVPIHVNDIRPYPPQFTFPILTTEYELIDLPADPSDELLTRLEKQLAVGAVVNFDEVIYNKEDNNYSLRIKSLME